MVVPRILVSGMWSVESSKKVEKENGEGEIGNRRGRVAERMGEEREICSPGQRKAVDMCSVWNVPPWNEELR